MTRPASLLLVTLLLCGCAASDPDDVRPNIIWIMADDMGYSDIGSYGSEIRTPHLDRLAAEGLRFSRFYNAARCCPTRASLLTGRYPHQAGMGRMVSSVDSDPEAGPYQGYLNRTSATAAEVLGQHGYRTYMSGKWHVGEKPEHWPTRRGFDRYFGLISGASSYFGIIEDQPRVRQMAMDGEPWSPPDSGFYMTDAFSDQAARYVRSHQADHPDEPFFLYLAYTAPHWPLHALPEDIARYEDTYHVGWDSLRTARHERLQALGLIDEDFHLPERPDDIPAWRDADDKDDWARRMAVYAAMIDRMDQGIGRVLAALEETGQLENTLIMFLADNGGSHENITGRGLHDEAVPIGEPGSYQAYRQPWANASNTPFRLYKSWAHEGGIATPFIAYWPDMIDTGGAVTDAVGHVMDLMATSLAAAQASMPDSVNGEVVGALEGRSLLPVFEGSGQQQDRALFWEHIGNRAVRKGSWKMSYDRQRGQWELYDVERDPTETEDLSGKHPKTVQALDSLWHQWAQRVGVQIGG